MSEHVRKLTGQELATHLEQLNQKLVEALIDSVAAFERGVHDSRKIIKELRACLRLLSPVLEEKHSMYETQIRMIAAELGQYRDQHVVADVWMAVSRDIPASLLETVDLPEVLDSPEDLPQLQDMPGTLKLDLPEYLSKLQQHFTPVAECLKASDLDHTLLNERFIWLYKRSHKAAKKAQRGDSAEHFHTLRKRLKDEMYCLRIFRPSWPKSTRRRHKQLKSITELLGHANDLDMLIEVLDATRDPLNQTLAAAISVNQQEAWDEALRELSPLFDQSPRAYLGQLPLRQTG